MRFINLPPGPIQEKPFPYPVPYPVQIPIQQPYPVIQRVEVPVEKKIYYPVVKHIQVPVIIREKVHYIHTHHNAKSHHEPSYKTSSVSYSGSSYGDKFHSPPPVSESKGYQRSYTQPQSGFSYRLGYHGGNRVDLEEAFIKSFMELRQ